MKEVNNPQAVSDMIQKFPPEFASLIEFIRQTILKTDPMVGEQIKWNSPSFFYQGEMKAFNAKEYKRDIVVVNCRKNVALLVFPTGNTINDTSGILEGDYADGRRMITIRNMEEATSKSKQLQQVITQWLLKVEK